MKKNNLVSITATVIMLCATLINLSSCEKDEGKLPDIAFKTGSTYTSADKSIDSGTDILVGITAKKTEDKDVLKTFSITHTVNGGSQVTDQTINLTSAQEDTYSQDFTLTPTGSSGDQLKYTFTVTNRDGLINSVNFTITIN